MQKCNSWQNGYKEEGQTAVLGLVLTLILVTLLDILEVASTDEYYKNVCGSTQ